MKKIRGAFSSDEAAMTFVRTTAAQGVAFVGLEYRELETSRRSWVKVGSQTLVFAIFDDPKAQWPDEEIVGDSKTGWKVRSPN